MTTPAIPIVSVLPGAGWFIEHELPNGAFWREPLVGFMIHADGTGQPLIADAQGAVKCPLIVPGKSALVPPTGFLRKPVDHFDADPAIDLELTIIRMVENSGQRGLTVEEIALRAHAEERDVKERLEHLRGKELVERSDRCYKLGKWPVHALVRALRHRYKKDDQASI